MAYGEAVAQRRALRLCSMADWRRKGPAGGLDGSERRTRTDALL